MVVSPWKTEKVLARIRRGESVGSIYNETRVPLAEIMALRMGIAPDPPVSKRRIYCHRYVRQARKAGMTVAGIMKHYGLSKEEVLSITRSKPKRQDMKPHGRAVRQLKSEGYTEEQIAAVFGK